MNPVDFHLMEGEKQTIFKITYFVFHRRMKFIQDWKFGMQWGWVNNYRTPGFWNCMHLLKLHWQAHQIRHLLSNHTFIDLMRAYNKAQKQSIIATIISSTTWISWIIHINKNKPILAFLTNIESVLHFQSFTYLTTTTQSGITLPTEGNLQLFKAAFRINIWSLNSCTAVAVFRQAPFSPSSVIMWLNWPPGCFLMTC